MYGYIYKTTNLKNGLIYIGQKHADHFLGNSYLGSGKLIRRAIAKEGKRNFTVELLEEVHSLEEMDAREIYWISVYHATNHNIGYNISEGGNVNRTMIGENNPFYGKIHSAETKNKIKLSKLKQIPWNKGLTKSTDSRVAKYATTQKQVRQYNCSTKNTVWINDGKKSKMVSVFVVDSFLNTGWVKGRLPVNKANYGKSIIGRIRINNTICEKTIEQKDLADYLAKGWTKGRLKFKDTSNFGKHNMKSVKCIETGKIYNSIKEAKQLTGINCFNCCKGKNNTAGGYHWSYVDD